MIKTVYRCFILLLALSVSACSSFLAAPYQLPDNSNPSQEGRSQGSLSQDKLPQVVELEAVSFFPQRRKQCGAAALATMLDYRDVSVTAEQLEPLLYLPGKDGTLTIDMVAQARQHAQLVYPLKSRAPQLDVIVRELNAGNPVLVMQNLGLSWLPQWHFAVVVGYNATDRTFTLRSGNTKHHLVAMKTFLSTWRRANFWAVVIVSPDTIPATAEPAPFLKAASDLEVVNVALAAQAYRAALRRWPDQHSAEATARLGLANIAYQQQQYPQSVAWLLDSYGPTTPVHWNNLAYGLMAMKCPVQAMQAIQCAVTQQPDTKAWQESLQELSVMAAEMSQPADDKAPINRGGVSPLAICPAQSALECR